MIARQTDTTRGREGAHHRHREGFTGWLLEGSVEEIGAMVEKAKAEGGTGGRREADINLKHVTPAASDSRR